MITTKFQILIGQDDETGNYVARIESVVENKLSNVQSTKIGQLMKQIGNKISKREVHNRKFPPPPVSPIIVPNGQGDKPLIVPAYN